jgi:hypothetical protein
MNKTSFTTAKKQEILATVRTWLHYAPLNDDTAVFFHEFADFTTEFGDASLTITLSNSKNNEQLNEKSPTNNG